ncbi:MAG TPA: ABC transporter ATP-binding protein, partial [Firmicutes bacterium]|nr:ABC transporter ATP-binding protein [Bacillota bacterium]
MANMMNALSETITVTHLSKQYDKRTVVDDLSFTVKSGQTLGLLGPNGAGKSTTIRILMGLSHPTAGAVNILGFDLHKDTKKIHQQIGVVFEKPNLFENLSGYQNLAIFCKLYDKPLSTIQPLLKRMDLWERAHDPVKVYSKGMKQRILILRALIHEPRLLFLDEPCSGLDPVSSRVIRDYLLELKAQGMTILLTSHDMEEVDELCDMIGFINCGRLIVLEETHRLKEKYGSSMLKVEYYETGELRKELLAPNT